jgi:hypothetical protein
MAPKSIFKNKSWNVEWRDKTYIAITKLTPPYPIGGGENYAFMHDGHVAYFFSHHSYIPNYIKEKVAAEFKKRK